VLACVLWYGKNAWVFGSFTSSTWLGMNLSRITMQMLPHRERVRLVKEGVLSELATRDSFGPLSRYADLMTLPPPTGIPVLDRPRKSRGESNFNHLAYIDLSRRYLRDSIALVRARPGVYLDGVSFALEHYVRPVSDLTEIVRILRPLGPYRDLAEIVMYGRIWSAGSPAGHCTFVMIGLPVLFLFGAGRLVRELRRDAPDLARAGLLAYLLLDIAYVTILGNTIDRGENQRFRFAIDPLLVVLLALLADWIRRAARRLEGRDDTARSKASANGSTRLAPRTRRITSGAGP
jgi:hypothetical protein